MHSKLLLTNNEFIAYHHHQGKENLPTVIFLGGFMSDMEGTKALAFEAFCRKRNVSFVRFDYFGHGHSSRKFTDGTIGIWKNNVLSVIDELTTGPLILIGSSMGGWLMILAALERKERIAAIIGIASAPDFTEDLIWDLFSEEEKKTLKKEKILDLASEYSDCPYPITLDLIEEGRDHLVLDGPIDVTVPVHLFHGGQDKDVPTIYSQKLLDKLTGKNNSITILEEADHRMSSPECLALICERLESLV